MRTFIRVNHKIKVPKVRCVGSDGEMIGVMPTRDAIKLALDADLDLVEVSPNADPPVCRVMDFGKYRYQESMKRKEARKHQVRRLVKEVKYHANVGEHDYQTKLNHARSFLEKGHKVKMTLTFRGRENAHRELGFEVIQRAIDDCADLATPDMMPRMIGRNIVCMLGSKKDAKN